MIYHLNFGIGWASSGVEYAQKYRAEILRQIDIQNKFVYLDFMSNENIQTLTSNIGFKDDEVIWLYQYFTDIDIHPTTYHIDDLVNSIQDSIIRTEQVGKIKLLVLPGQDNYVRCYMHNTEEGTVDRAEFVSNGKLIRKDYFNYTRLFSEYYAPKANKPELYLRHFYQEDGRIAYSEYINGSDSMFFINEVKLYSKAEFVAYFIQQLNLSHKDIVIIDRSTNIGQAVLQNKNDAKVGVVIHAEHFSDHFTDEEHILWNNFYDYVFTEAKHIDFYITATDAQNKLLKQQFEQYKNLYPKIYTIPVGSIDQLIKPKSRKRYSLISASRLASEKHIDLIAKAVIKAKKELPDLTLDIYGEGGEKEKLSQIIVDHDAQEYIKMKGHVDLKTVYSNYELFLSASQSEGFGLTLMEAVGSGLGMIGFDVNYGTKTFIEHEGNGFLIPLQLDQIANDEMINIYAKKIVDFYKSLDYKDVELNSYSIAKEFRTEILTKKWKTLIEEVQND